MKLTLIYILVSLCIVAQGQTYAGTSSGSIGSSSAPTGWTANGSPDYASVSIGPYSNTTWTSTLPAAPIGDTLFPVILADNPSSSISQTVTGLTTGASYMVTLSYMYPTATGTLATWYNRPVYQSAYLKLGTAARQYVDTFGFLASTNTWYTQTFTVTAADTSLVLELGMASNTAYRAAVAFSLDSIHQLTYLPVDYSEFSATRLNSTHVQLQWQTAQEHNNSHFIIEKSEDNQHFSAIGRVQGTGSSHRTSDYSYLENQGADKKECYYRLKQVDFDGAYSYSKTVCLLPSDKSLGIHMRLKRDELHFTGTQQLEGVQVELVTMSGELVHKGTIKDNQIALPPLRYGVYFARIFLADQVVVRKFLKREG